jgi:hypothetical protein
MIFLFFSFIAAAVVAREKSIESSIIVVDCKVFFAHFKGSL